MGLMDQQERERTESIRKNCLFCPKILECSWQAYVTHMQQLHGFNIGHPENLVFIAELVEMIESKMKR